MKPDSPTSPPTSSRVTIREFFAVVFRRRWIILGLFLAVSVTVGVVLATTPASYISSGQVLLRRGEVQSALTPDRRVMNDWEVELGSEVQTVKSWPVLKRAQKLLDEENRPAHSLKLRESGVEVDVTGKSNVLAIGYVDRDPEVAQRVCDAVIRAYVDYRQSAELTYPRRFFEAEISQATSELQRWMDLRRQYSNQTGSVDLPIQRSTLLGLRAGMEQRRSEAAAELAEVESQMKAMRMLAVQPASDMPAMGPSGVNDNVIVAVKTSIVQQESRIADLRERYRDDSPDVMNARATLDTLQSILAREIEGRIQVGRSRIESIRARMASIDRDLAATDRKLESMPDRDARLAEMNHQIDSWKARYDDLVKSSQQALVNENTMPVISAYVLNPASPARRQNARDYVRVGLAPAFSLVVGIGLAFFIDGLDITVHTAGQAEEEVQLPVLAAITDRKRRGCGWKPGSPRETPA